MLTKAVSYQHNTFINIIYPYIPFTVTKCIYTCVKTALSRLSANPKCIRCPRCYILIRIEIRIDQLHFTEKYGQTTKATCFINNCPGDSLQMKQ